MNSTFQCNVKDVLLSRGAGRYKEVENAVGNNWILACIFNFLQTSREVVQVRINTLWLYLYNNCEFSYLAEFIGW